MRNVFIIGTHSTAFGRKPDETHKQLARETVSGLLADAGLNDGQKIEAAWFANCALHGFGQASIRGQVCLSELANDRILPERLPIFNVENACATGSNAVHGAWLNIASGAADLALAVGVEKLFVPDARTPPDLAAGSDRLNPEVVEDYLHRMAANAGAVFQTGPDRTMFMDAYALQARIHMQRFGTTARQIAIACAKTHNFGADNDKAQYRFRMTPDEVLADRMVSDPLTRAMCAPIGDGSASVLLCSEAFLGSLDPAQRDRAVRIRGIGVSGGKYRSADEPSLTRIAAHKAYALAGIGPQDVDVAEVHDATSFGEIYQTEMLELCEPGKGGRFFEEGGGQLDHRVTINASGGLISKGHPIAATGCSMIHEVVLQLRGEAGLRQKRDAAIGIIENGGGMLGFDEAVCFVTVLEKA